MLTIEKKRKRFILYKDNEAIGHCKYKESKGVVRICFLFIEKEYRRQGYATVLISKILRDIGPIEIQINKECTPDGVAFFRQISHYYNIRIVA